MREQVVNPHRLMTLEIVRRGNDSLVALDLQQCLAERIEQTLGNSIRKNRVALIFDFTQSFCESLFADFFIRHETQRITPERACTVLDQIRSDHSNSGTQPPILVASDLSARRSEDQAKNGEEPIVPSQLKLDHLVYGVPDLVASIDEFSRRLGRAPRPGGRHEGLGTHNAILPLAGETYVELIARDPDAPAPHQPRPFGLDTLDGPRLITWAVRSRSIEADVDEARKTGFDPGLILDMSRRSPAGELLEWKLTIAKKPFGDGLVPFVIDWGRTPHPALSDQNEGDEVVLANFSASHPDPESISNALAALGVELNVETSLRTGLSAHIKGPSGSLILA